MNDGRRTIQLCLLLGFAILPAMSLAAEESIPRTRAELTRFIETTRYPDVIEIVEQAAAASPHLHATRFGYSAEGRALPLVVIGDVSEPSPEAVHGSGKLRVYLQGNIHGGEVAGKEALLMLIRALATGERRGWHGDLVLLVGPILNADGNEAVRLTNRPLQHGPIGGMGTRANAQGYDLNRDHMKLDSPEVRSVVQLMRTWDPHVFLDLHTTNGTHHGYHLTYAPPLNPATPAAIDELLRRRLLPAVTERIRVGEGWHLYHYGNVMAAPTAGGTAWMTFDHRPRFATSYAGIRNRIGILSEVYAYLPLEERVRVTYRFVEELLDLAAADAARIKALTAAEDEHPLIGEQLPLRGVPEASAEPAEILLGDVTRERHPYTGETLHRRTAQVRPKLMREYVAFGGSDHERVPAAYLLPPALETAAERLAAHGIEIRPLGTVGEREVEFFRIDAASRAEEPFQGRRERTVEGRWVEALRNLPAETLVVDMRQPLARLAFLLLEPKSDDGLLAWDLLDGELNAEYPILRSHEPQ